MYKSDLSHQKIEKQKYPSSKAYNLLSPPYNPKQKSKGYINSNLPKFKPINLYSTCLSPFQSEKNLSVKNIVSPDDKLSQNLMNKFSDYQKNVSSKMFGSPNTTNSDLLTAASMTSQKSNESILSNNTNTSIYIPTTFQPVTMYDFRKGHRYNFSSMMTSQMTQINMTNFYNMNNIFINGNCPNVNMTCIKPPQGFNNQKQNKNGQNIYRNVNKFGNYSGKNKNNDNKKNVIKGEEEKINVNNFNSNNSSKSGSSSNKTGSDSCKNSSSNNSNSNNSNALASSQNLSIKSKNSKNIGNPQRKKYYNKFNSSKENSTNENTVILTLKIKVAKDDYRVFNLKKYDDLFISLEKFFDLNKIEQNLVKPIVTKIFTALNKIFWLLNNKIGIYDQEYLNSLYKVWIKNNEKIPKRNDTEKNKSKDSSNNNSTISSSDSTDENKKHKKLLSNSFQNMDNLSEDEKQNTIKSI
jgi:hypothetical protein